MVLVLISDCDNSVARACRGKKIADPGKIEKTVVLKRLEDSH